MAARQSHATLVRLMRSTRSQSAVSTWPTGLWPPLPAAALLTSTVKPPSAAVGRRQVVAAMAPSSNRVRFGARFGWAVLALAMASDAAAGVVTPPTDPSAFVVSAGGNLYVGNGTRVPGPVGANGSLLLD